MNGKAGTEDGGCTASQGCTVSTTTKLRDCCEPRVLFEVEQLSVSFSGQRVLRDVSLQLYDGCKTALIGPSGSGKSTFLLALSRLILLHEHHQLEGVIRYRGEDIYATGRARRDFARRFRREVGFVFQKPTPFPLSIWNNLSIPLRECGPLSRADREERIVAALETVGLWEEVRDRLKHPAQMLSGGQQQRLCIARALVLEPRVMLMDEPTSSLDPIAASVVEGVIQRVSGERTVVIVTHNIAQARRLADYLAVFWAGASGSNLVESGVASIVFDRPRHERTAALLAGSVG